MIGENIKKLRKEISISQETLGKAVGVTTSAIGMYERNEREPNFEILQKIADHFNVSVDFILGRTDSLNRVAVLRVIRADEPILAEQNIVSYEYLPAGNIPKGECFFLQITGDSMNSSKINDGDLVLVKKQDKVENGEIALVAVDNESATVKKYIKNDDLITLLPHSSNPQHLPRMIDTKKATVRVVGKVISVKSVVNFE